MIRALLLILPGLILLGAPLTAQAGEAEVAAAAEAALVQTWPDLADAEVRVVRLSGGAETAAPPLRVRFSDGDAPLGRVSAEVERQLGDGTWERAGWAFLDVVRFETAAVLTRDVPRGEPIPPDAVRLDRLEHAAHSDFLPPAALAASEWRATRTLRAGTALTHRLVEAPPAAEPGDPVRVHYERGGIQIALDGVARERGAVGDHVRVYCSDTRSTLRVRLTGPGEGEWTATL